MKHPVSGMHRAFAAALIAIISVSSLAATGDATPPNAPITTAVAPAPTSAAAPTTAPAAAPTPAPAPAPAWAPTPAYTPAPAPLSTAPTAPTDSAAPTPNPAASEPSEDIRDIRGPKFILPAWFWPALLAGVALLTLGAYGLWRWLQRRRRGHERALLPFEVALQRLENLRALMQPPHAREFSTEASGIVRSYIEQRFNLTATHQTTEEFLRDLLESSNASLARHRALLSAFLQQCDLVKFAGISLTLQSMESLHQSARTFVLETAQPDQVTAQPEAVTEIRTAPHATQKEAHDSLSST